MEAICPQCHHAMTWQNGDVFGCPHCRQRYRRAAYCPECRHELQTLKACGALDYFCQQGHGLISSKRVIFDYLPVDR
ncbi:MULTISPECIES: zinc ribbon domain-containing protein [unclassified Brenneria]|uniref:zinc ribbon domain-containing protein n=1 Tax=unclassified Brenneria TaxID=2634434 RepID=UPI001557F952|nr:MULTISPECIES: zinc ribbon domain-containing protein [unclassified Brenneria]MEE3645130.1 zinc ribbon domain-containing protein [Brenneria sp. L3_3C_1]MEE3652773.1 zinc ribbon domain-containing protein [Brenneria sp. HEZEL_4_2_4]MBJ7223885.1 zinc ribbon domain-containing protein [Brenneria sp. L3-3C-1]MEE3652812.1 zinc ribbon domain-containing protein [Brenneria sp. HEZEL_4_2_4]NPD02729.1 zinc ribbon domain-containing protein [Brenneria sp. hezel4-2-4]